MPAISHAPTSQQRYYSPLQTSSTEHSRPPKAPLSTPCRAAVTQPPHNLGSQFQDVVPHGGDMKAAVMWGSWSHCMDSLLLHSLCDPIHGIGLPTFKVGPSTSLSAAGSQQTLPETSQLWLETVLLWTENVSRLYKVFHSNCYHDLIPKTKALFYLLPDFFSNCANSVTRVCAHKHPFCSLFYSAWSPFSINHHFIASSFSRLTTAGSGEQRLVLFASRKFSICKHQIHVSLHCEVLKCLILKITVWVAHKFYLKSISWI